MDQPLTGEAFRGFVTAKLQDIDRRLEAIERNGHGPKWLAYTSGTAVAGVIALVAFEVIRLL